MELFFSWRPRMSGCVRYSNTFLWKSSSSSLLTVISCLSAGFPYMSMVPSFPSLVCMHNCHLPLLGNPSQSLLDKKPWFSTKHPLCICNHNQVGPTLAGTDHLTRYDRKELTHQNLIWIISCSLNLEEISTHFVFFLKPCGFVYALNFWQNFRAAFVKQSSNLFMRFLTKN